MAPACSIVIPTHGRPRQLAECLDGIAALDYPRDLIEVVVVGDGGEAVVDSARGQLDVTWVSQAPRGPSPARNEGVARARHELIAFLDDDCRPTRDWLSRLVAGWAEDPDAAFGGHVVNALTANRYARASQLVIDAGYRQNGRQPNVAGFFCTNNLLLGRGQFLELGGFDEGLRTAEDRDLADRWLERGWRMRYVPDAQVLHAHRMGLRGFLSQHFAYGRGARRLWSKRAASGRGRLRLERDLYEPLALAPVRAGSGRLELAFLLALWLSATTAGYVYEALASAR